MWSLPPSWLRYATAGCARRRVSGPTHRNPTKLTKKNEWRGGQRLGELGPGRVRRGGYDVAIVREEATKDHLTLPTAPTPKVLS